MYRHCRLWKCTTLDPWFSIGSRECSYIHRLSGNSYVSVRSWTMECINLPDVHMSGQRKMVSNYSMHWLVLPNRLYVIKYYSIRFLLSRWFWVKITSRKCFSYSVLTDVPVIVLDPCTSNVVLNDATRSIDYQIPSGSAACDNSLTSAWYRLQLYGQDALMPTACPSVNTSYPRICGTSSPGWYKGECFRIE